MSILIFLLSLSLSAESAVKFSDKCEAALVASRTRIASLFENPHVEVENLGPQAGLTSDHLVKIESPAERDIVLHSRKNLRDDVRSALESITLEEFKKHFFVLSSLGLSRWSYGPILPVGEVRFDQWKKLNGESVQDWFDQGLMSSGSLQGLNPLVEIEFKTSVRMAIRAARIVRNEKKRKMNIWLEDGNRKDGLSSLDSNQLFRHFLEIEAVRGIGKTPGEIKEALSFGDRLRHHGRHKLMLPFRYVEARNGRGKLKMDKSDQSHLRAIALRFTHLKQLVIGQGRAMLSDEHALFLAVFPEFTGLFASAIQNQVDMNLSHLDQIIDNSARYQFGLGAEQAFWWDLIFLKFLHTDLKAHGIGSLHLNLYLGRTFDPLNHELADIDLQVDVSPFDLSGSHMRELTIDQKRAIVNAISRELPDQRLALSIEDVERISERRAPFQLRAVKSARSETTALIEAFFTLQEMTMSGFNADYDGE